MNKAEAGSLGGKATAKKYGLQHMQEIGQHGGEAFHKKYKLVKFGANDFLIVNRETEETNPKTLLGYAAPCQHRAQIGDNYGLSCKDCEIPLEGYGYGGWFGVNIQPRQVCIHRPVKDGGEMVCLFCQRILEVKI